MADDVSRSRFSQALSSRSTIYDYDDTAYQADLNYIPERTSRRYRFYI